MFLKRLEVIGFKSFAERIGVDFVPGVTAVVGPNGSGKSNVTDAIRWVLGEQSAKSLRGAKMEDVIFSGSDSRKPLNFAEVTLVLDNQDERIAVPYTEISVTRRVYRSGESEYLLNNQQCRLKDITDLFMDSGLGKEAFSIISQGRVDEILNSRPEDRRLIFEEAAGVLKYKLRKKKAEFKLVETDENLHRVLDILHELNSRLEPLQMQASAAKDYLRMTAELKDADIALIAHDLTECYRSLQVADIEYTKLAQTEQQHAGEMAEKNKQLRDIRTQLKLIDEALDQSQEQLIEASTEVERWEGRKALVNEKRQNAEKHLQQLQLSLVQTNEEEQQLIQQESANKEQFNLKQKQVQQLKQAIKQLEQSLTKSVAEIEADIEQAKNHYIDLLNEEATTKNELKHLEQQLTQHQETALRMTGRSEEAEKELQQVQALKQNEIEQLTQLDAKYNGQMTQLEALEMEISSATNQLDEKQALLYKAYQHHQQLKARKETLAELEADFSGFFQGVKEILLARERGQLTGIVGAVAELLQIEGQYTAAIETALGAASQHIVTENEQHAQQAISWLKQRRAGRATFLPKTVMRSRKIYAEQLPQVAEHPAFISFADELVQYNISNQIIIQNLLGNVIVAKHLQGASQIARLCNYKYRVVTLEGDIVNAGGSLTGGAMKQQSSVFSRKLELDTLVEKLSELEKNIATAERTVAKLKAQVTTLAEQADAIKLTQNSLQSALQQHKTKIVELEVQEKNLQQTVALSSSEHSSAATRKEQLAQQQRQAQERLQQITIELAKINEQVEQLTEAKVYSDTQKDALREQSAEKRSELAVAVEQLTQLQATAADIALKRSKIQQQFENISQEIKWLQSEEGAGPTIEEIEQAVIDWTVKKQDLTNVIQTEREARTAYQQQSTNLEQSLQELSRIHKGFVDALRTLELKRNRTQYELETLEQQLEEQYELSYEEAQEAAIAIDDIEQMRRTVRLLKLSIEELGPVNIAAIEEYERVQERHSFLTEQRNDLVEAQETLQEAIKEMDEEMKMRFASTFTAIRAQFKIVFRELFGGGQADLILFDENNILETGIDIVAQPPGKKLQTLSLLSGGERALTAIALLFAILKTRPVPFCILDEVEAALDESNVMRYSQYLKKFSEQTQFIVITHRKGTMEGADVLYGITMQESGVSKLVSVKLEEVELVEQRSGT
ncbi:chromosome segregation protein SMC [Metasolibacillus fluoroglycofenilyticus]|uniref:chromosome segregation protein SMC n=1 Tax=Metasolibacillus fluoroglycofenilyticus TaxID=1239396 RepID=UPI000D340414|nr:chromosome segregation protein SMC [Metasolibacillus fluoroglycofenilyticus]